MPGSVRRRLTRLLICAAVAAVLGVGLYQVLIGIPYGPQAKGDLAAARSDRPGQRVLFVGNSMTYWNSMPSMVRKLAHGDPGAPTLFVAQYTAPGWDLTRAAKHDGLRRLMEEVGWDEVVLQEKSSVYPPKYEALHRRIRSRSGDTLIFGGWSESQHPAAAEYARTLPAVVAPVGVALDRAYRARPGIDLDDGTGHFNRAGSFLVACVFYAQLTGRDPARSAYVAGLEPALSRFLKRTAWEAYGFGAELTAT
jgi:hypothetical protein